MVYKLRRETFLLRTHRTAARARTGRSTFDMTAKIPPIAVNPNLEVLRKATVGLVRNDRPDLTARQMGVLLTCYLNPEPQTVRGLAAELNVSKPAVTRALNRLAEFDLIKRKADPSDGRSLFVERTPKGAKFVNDLSKLIPA